MLDQIEDFPEFDNHKLIALISDKDNALRGYIAIHKGNPPHPSLGATRYWEYESDEAALRDVLRLSKMMSYKSAMAGLKYGGAKGVIMKNSKTESYRNKILSSYAKKVNYLSGQFITGTDAGLTDKDVKFMRKISKFFVGTQANPARFTAYGVFIAAKECLKQIFENDELGQRSIAIQGVGKTGYELLKLIYPTAGTVYVTDINKRKLLKAKKQFPRIIITGPDEIYRKRIDIFSPCALRHCVSSKNIGKIRSKIIVGCANNQLENDRLGGLLHKWGVLYAPDYVVNAGGLISVADEYENGNFRVKRAVKKVKKIKNTLNEVFKKSKRTNKPTNIVANEIAEKKLESMK